jgi:hypothetical protein
VSTVVSEHELRWARSGDIEPPDPEGQPPRAYRERIQQAADKGESPSNDQFKALCRRAGVTAETALLRAIADLRTAKARRHARRELARSDGLFQQYESLSSRLRELEQRAEGQHKEPPELAETHERACRTFSDAVERRRKALQTLHDTAREDLRRAYQQATRNGELSRERNELSAKYNGNVGKELARLRDEAVETEEVMARLLDGQQLRNKELPTWRARIRFCTRPEAREEEGREIDHREPATILAELRTHLGKLREQRGKVQQDAARVAKIGEELERMREEAAKVERQIVQPVNMRWSDL